MPKHNPQFLLRLTTAALALLAGALTGAGQAAAQPFTFSTAGSVGTYPGSVAVGDLNGDGRLDIATANFFGNNVSVLLNNGNGTYTVTTAGTVGGFPSSVAVGDLNGDGRLDLATANNNNTVSVLLNNGDGTYSINTFGVGGSGPSSVTMGDLNGDGRLDLAIANNNNTVSVLLNNGDGTYTVTTAGTVGSSPSSVAVGDLNGDGRLDLATANNNNTVSVLLNNGDGTYTVSTAGSVGSTPKSVVVGDLNGDGRLDIATANNASTNVSVLLNNGNGTYTVSTAGTVGSTPESMAAGDFNGDGRLDLATANFNNYSVLLNNGDGTYTVSNVSIITNPVGVAAGDFNGDGQLDLATGNLNSNTVGVLLNQRAATEPSAPASTSSGPGVVGYTAPSNANNVLIVRSLTSDPAPTPVDNTEYQIGDAIGSGIVVAIRAPGAGNSGSFTDNTGTPGQSYRYSVFAFTGSVPQTVGQLATTGVSPNFGPASITLDSPLPVELSGFTGSGKNARVALVWGTATERDNAGFVLLRNGVEIASYRTAATLRGHGTSAQPSAYGYTDATVEIGRSYSYRLRSVDIGGEIHDYPQSVTVTVEAVEAPPVVVVPAEFRLSQATPNPFNPSTHLTLSLPEASTVTATVFNALGQPVGTLRSGEAMSAATHDLVFDATAQPTGAYLIRVTAVGQSGKLYSQARRVMLVK